MDRFIRRLPEKIEKHPVRSVFCAAVFLTLFMELLSRRSLWSLLVFVGTRPHIFLYNVCIVLWTFSLLLLVKRRLFWGTVISVVWMILGIADFVLLSFRVTPFNGADLRLTKDAVLVAGKYLQWWHVVLMAAAIVGLAVLFVFLFRKLPRSRRKISYLKSGIFIIFSLLALFGANSVATAAGIFSAQFGNLAEAYQDYGFSYCFANSLVNTGIKRPEDYSMETVQEIKDEEIVPESHGTSPLVLEEEPDVVNETGIAVTEQTPNIIFLQLESFSDPMKYLQIECSEDPIPNYRKLMEQYSSGYLSVPSVGAGTANTEFEVITGMNLDFFGPGEYPYKTVLQKEVCESLCFDLKEMGYHAHAIHNNSGTFYDRYTVFSQLGFDTFTSLEYMSDYETTYMGWAKDKVLTEQIGTVLDSTTGADMIYTISVQGHGAYPEEQVIESPDVTVTGLADEGSTNAMEYYIQQIHEMDEFVGELVSYLKNRGEETILVMYGDHLPSLGLTEENLENGNLYQTEYVIWDNIGLTKTERNIEAYQLGAYVLGKAGIQKGTMFRYHQSYLEESVHTKDEKESYLEDMKILEYDILYGEQDVFEGDMPYEATDLHMGVKTIAVSQVLNQGEGLYVTGWNFTPSSVIYVNGKACETNSVSENLLYTSDFELDEGENKIEVSQVSSDNIVLSTSDAYVLEK